MRANVHILYLTSCGVLYKYTYVARGTYIVVRLELTVCVVCFKACAYLSCVWAVYEAPVYYCLLSLCNTQAVRNLHPLICRFYFLDGKAKAIGVDPSATASDVIKALAEKIELQNVDGWALFEVNPDKEHFVRSHEYIADILAQWER